MSVSGKSAFETGPSAADSTAGEREKIEAALFAYRNNLLDRFPPNSDMRQPIFEVFAETLSEVFNLPPPPHKRPPIYGSMGSIGQASNKKGSDDDSNWH